MILRSYPDKIDGLKRNFIIHFKTSNTELGNHVSPLTVKCLMKGNEHFTTPDGKYNVTAGNYLILNEGQECESIIVRDSETFSVYFENDFVKENLQSLLTPDDKILEFSFLPLKQPVNFFEKIYHQDSIVSPVLMKLRLASKVDYDDENWLTDQYCELLDKLLMMHRKICCEIEKLPPVKLSTKTELYKRVCRAKEFIDCKYNSNISIEIIAKEACLSQFHFLRVFKSVFNITPHRYISKKRMEKASGLLRNSDLPVTEICFETGFESPGSFSRIFKNSYGLSPEKFRENYRQYIYKHKFI